MKMECATEKPDCYKCKHRRSVPGDAHSRCAHPKVTASNLGSGLFDATVALISGKSLEVATELGITANLHGIKMGWFMWPVNFDPTWLRSCTGFEGA